MWCESAALAEGGPDCTVEVAQAAHDAGSTRAEFQEIRGSILAIRAHNNSAILSSMSDSLNTWLKIE